MSKMYDRNGNKMTTFEVIEEMTDTISAQQAKIIYTSMKFWMPFNLGKRTVVILGLIQSYKFLPRNTDEDERVSRCAKHIIDKYIKSTVSINDDECKMYDKLHDRIIKLAENKHNTDDPDTES